MTRPASPHTDPESVRRLEECLAAIRDALGRVRFGQVTITVHEGRVVQLEITEKQRIAPH
ncbi:MAG: YezD family protein [Gammaproteobacteria bacterium]